MDTPFAAPDTRAPRRTLAAALAPLALLLMCAGVARGEPRELDATVVWTRAGFAYVADADSGALEPGALVTLTERDDRVAWGAVARVVDGVLAVVRLDGGSLEGVKHLDRLRVLAEPAPVAPLPLLRVGVPDGPRANLAVACPRAAPSAAMEAYGYRVAPATAGEWRGVRDGAPDPRAPWPDTLVVRAYRLAADEEIALERGELDVAVFWPGEASAHLRDGPLGRDALLAPLARGVIAALQPPPTRSTADSLGAAGLAAAIRADAALAALDAQMFGGDLLPWAAIDTTGQAADAGRLHGGRAHVPVTVDAAFPGQRVLQRFLDRDLPAAWRGSRRAVRLSVLDEPPVAGDSLRAAHWARGVVPLYALRCAVVAGPARLALARALGGGAFADLASCAPGGRRP